MYHPLHSSNNGLRCSAAANICFQQSFTTVSLLLDKIIAFSLGISLPELPKEPEPFLQPIPLLLFFSFSLSFLRIHAMLLLVYFRIAWFYPAMVLWEGCSFSIGFFIVSGKCYRISYSSPVGIKSYPSFRRSHQFRISRSVIFIPE